jgi:hypothetical protein
MYPETMEVVPPMRKATVVYGKLTSDGSAVNANKIANNVKNPAKKRYSCLRKVIAPSSMSA